MSVGADPEAEKPPLPLARTWLIAGLPGSERAAVIAACLARLPADESVSLLLEGHPSGSHAEVPAASGRTIHVLAPGCLCCIGNLTLRVTLARVLRLEAPRHIVIAIADARHEARIRAMLQATPWDAWLQFEDLADSSGRS